METPGTAQKRKFDSFEDLTIENGPDTEEDLRSSEYDRTPKKRIRSSGTFEPAKKRKESEDRGKAAEERFPDRTDFKRRRL
jgi:hypothetical protein